MPVQTLIATDGPEPAWNIEVTNCASGHAHLTLSDPVAGVQLLGRMASLRRYAYKILDAVNEAEATVKGLVR